MATKLHSSPTEASSSLALTAGATHGVEVESAGNEDVESGVSGFASGYDKVLALDRTEIGADEDRWRLVVSDLWLVAGEVDCDL